MDWKTAVPLAGLIVVLVLKLWDIGRHVGRLEQKLDELWDAYTNGRRRVGRRATAHERQPGADR